MSSRAGTESVEPPRELYKVIEEKRTDVRGFMGSERGYDVAGAAPRVLGQEDRGTKVRLVLARVLSDL